MKLSLLLNQLDKNQVRALHVLRHNDGGAVWHRVGEGKTRIAYVWFATIANVHQSESAMQPIFIVVCRRAAFGDWQEEARKLGLDWTVVDYEKFLGNKRRVPRVFLVSHGMLHKLRADISALGAGVCAVVYDEGYLFKTVSTQHCKAANHISLSVPKTAILSGSIMTARNLEDVYGQLYAINRQDVLARTLTEFRTRYMFRLQIGGDFNFKFVNRRGAAETISERISRIASIYFPPSKRQIRYIRRTVEATNQQIKYFSRLKREYYLEEGGRKLDIKSAPSLIVKCQQISDGFLTFSEGEKLPVNSGKMDYLMGLLGELLDAGERVIVWCAFRHTVALVLQRLQKQKIHSYGLTGGSKFNIEGWRKNGQVAVATVDCGSSINYFGQCAYAIYYSMSWKWLSLQQSRGRTDRHDSQHKTCFYYHLYTASSLDSFVHRTALSSARQEKELIDLTEVKQWLNP